ncbi:MAG: rhodanese-like domain-containing protein [bacterium]|nr:rhodanese-like domain-containing protein [bacterium]
MGMYFIPVWEVDYYLGRPEFVFIDVRSYAEYSLGHLLGAGNFPLERIESWRTERFGEKIPIFYCERGSKSLRAAMEISAQGRNAGNISGGICCYQGRNWVR